MAPRKKAASGSKTANKKKSTMKTLVKKAISRNRPTPAKKSGKKTSATRTNPTKTDRKFVNWRKNAGLPRCINDIRSTGLIGRDTAFNLGTTRKVEMNKRVISFEFKYNKTVYNGYTSMTNEDVAKQNLAKLKENYSHVMRGVIWAELQKDEFKRNSTSRYLLCIKNIDSIHSTAKPVDFENEKLFDYVKSQVKSRKSFDLDFDEITILDGNVYRYPGCKECSKGLPSPGEHGKFYCSTCKKRWGPKTRKKCTIIWNLTIKDTKGTIIRGPIVFHDECVKLLGTSAINSKLDSEVEEAFEKLIGSTVKGSLEHKLPTKSKTTPFNTNKLIFKNVEASKTKFKTPLKKKTVQKCQRLEQDDGCDDGESNSSSASTNANVGSILDGLPCLDLYIKYEMKENDRGFYGLAIMINVNSQENQKLRCGSEKDVADLESALPKRGIEIFSGDWGKAMEDLTKMNIQQRINEFKAKLLSDEYSFSMFIFMGHGVQNGIKLSDGSPINIYKDVMMQFTEDMFLEFSNKPKLFVFQSCQTNPKNAKNRHFTLPTSTPFANMLWCLPCLPGQSALRHTDTGTLFIQSLVESLSIPGERDLEAILYEVQSRLKNSPVMGGEYNIPTHQKICFRPFMLPWVG